MVTMLTYGGHYNTAHMELVGLSTDVKPTVDIDGISISNGSYFYEMDTKKYWQFDEANKTWLEQ